MVPPWVPDPVPPEEPADGGDDDQDEPDQPPPPPPTAPPRRFGPARTSLGRFAKTGSSDKMRRGVGHYVRRGLGGSGTATRRLGGTTRTAGALYGALSSAAAGDAAVPGGPLDPDVLAGRSVNEIMDAVIDAVRPVDGTLDAEASRGAIRDALSDLLERFPDADLLNLNEDQRFFAVERFLAFDVYMRLRLDVGEAVKDKAPSVATALSRLREVRDYVRETVGARFRALRKAAEKLSARSVARIANRALRAAFEVFEDYVA